MPLERLQKIISAAGIASRRAAEELITTGRVEVNGKMVTELGAKADTATDEIRVNGSVLHVPKQHMYLVMNKPKGYVTTVSDPEGRETVMDLLPPDCPRVYPIGRLDYLTEGLLLFTNDGELAYKLMHASSKVPKTYLVKVSGEPTEQDVERLRSGVRIPRRRKPEEGGGHVKTAPADIKWVRHAENPWLQVTLIEGKNRQIRKMFEEIGHHIEKIRRTHYGPLELDLEPGALRSLKPNEVTELKIAAGLIKGISPRTDRPRKSPKADIPNEQTAAPTDDSESAAARKRPIFDRKKPSAAIDAPADAERPRRSTSGRGNYAFGARSNSDRRPSRPAGDRGERPFRPRRDDERPARTGGSERRSFRPRTDSDRPAREDRPFRPRDEGDDRRPSRPPRADSDRKPFRPRRDDERPAARGDRPFRPRTEGENRRPSRAEGERRPFRPRTEDDQRPSRGDRPFRPRSEGEDSRSSRPPRADGDRKPFRPREDGERRPFRPRTEGDRPFRPRRDDDQRQPRSDRPRRDNDDRPARPPRADGERRRFRPRSDGDQRPPRADRPFRPRRDDDQRPPRGNRPFRPRRDGESSGTRPDRPSSRPFKDRPPRPSRDENRPRSSRPPREGERSDRPRSGPRPPRPDRGDRPPRPNRPRS